MMYAMTLSRSFSAIENLASWGGMFGAKRLAHALSFRVFSRRSRKSAHWDFGDLIYGISYSVAFGTICTRKRRARARESPGSCALTYRGNRRAKKIPPHLATAWTISKRQSVVR